MTTTKPRKTKLPGYVRRQVDAQRKPSHQETPTVQRARLEETARKSLSKSIREIHARHQQQEEP